MQFFVYSNISVNKPTVEDFLYRKREDVYSFFTEVTNAEDAAALINILIRVRKRIKRKLMSMRYSWRALACSRSQDIWKA